MPSLSRRSVRVAAAVSGVLALAFAIGAYVVVPYLIAAMLAEHEARAEGRVVRAERIAVNPFSLSVSLGGLTLSEPAARAAFSVVDARLNFGFRSLLGRQIALDALSLDGLVLEVRSGAAGAKEPVDMRFLRRWPPVRIERLEVRAGRLQVGSAPVDAEKEPLVLDGVRLVAERLGTDAGAAGSLRLEARDVAGGSVRIEGEVALREARSRGRLTVDGADLERLRPWLGNGVLAAGAARIEADYDYRWSPRTSLDLHRATATVQAPRIELGQRMALGAATLDAAGDAALRAGRVQAEGRLVLVSATLSDGTEPRLEAARIEAAGARLTGNAPRGTALSAAALRLRRPETTLQAFEEVRDEDDFESRLLALLADSPRRGAAEPPGAAAARAGEALRTGRDGPDASSDAGRAGAREPRDLGGDGHAGTLSLAVDRMEIDEGILAIAAGEAPMPRIRAVGVSGVLARLEGRPGEIVIDLEGRLEPRGRVQLLARAEPFAAESREAVELHVRGAEPRALGWDTPVGDDSADAGRVDLDVEYHLRGKALAGRVRLAAGGPVLAAWVGAEGGRAGHGRTEDSWEDSRRPGRPLHARTSGRETAGSGRSGDLALALLADAAGRVDLRLPVTGTASDAAGIVEAVRGSLRRRLEAAAAAPFGVLAEITGFHPTSLSSVSFAAGEAAPSPASAGAIAGLSDALAARPRVGLSFAGVADPVLDRDALAARQIELHVALGGAAAPPSAGPEPIDFTSAHDQELLAQFAGERLGAERLETIRSHFARDAEGEVAASERASYYRALFDALVEREPIPESALVRLARYRARAIADVLTERGVAAARIERQEPVLRRRQQPDARLPADRPDSTAEPTVDVPLELWALPAGAATPAARDGQAAAGLW